MEAIGNVLGRFIKCDDDALQSNDRRMEKKLVEVDMHGGLLDYWNIEWHGLVFSQCLYYLGVPFRCAC